MPMKSPIFAKKSFLRYCTALLLGPLAVLHAGEPAPAGPMILPAMVDVLTETWRAAGITFESANTYPNPLIAAELNVLFTSPSGKQVVVPGFWDGGRTWRVRFAPTEYGVWKYVSTCSDTYQHPGTAHMEFMGGKPEPKEFPPKNERPRWGYGVLASTSGFRDVPGHTWYGVQWTPPHESGIHWLPVKDFWENGQSKPVVNYEGSYDHLWTLGDGARQQGWAAYLNGMFGHGYGAIDIWLYDSKYDMDKATVRGSVTVTVEQKKTKWITSVDFPSATELGVHMKIEI